MNWTLVGTNMCNSVCNCHSCSVRAGTDWARWNRRNATVEIVGTYCCMFCNGRRLRTLKVLRINGRSERFLGQRMKQQTRDRCGWERSLCQRRLIPSAWNCQVEYWSSRATLYLERLKKPENDIWSSVVFCGLCTLILGCDLWFLY